MDRHLIDEAKEDGMKEVVVSAIIENQKKQILLIENLEAQKLFYRLPSAKVAPNESIQQALQRAVGLETMMEISEVKSYLGHYDRKGNRFYHFIVEVKDPYAVETNTKMAHAWLDVQEAVGYPIWDEVREMLDLYVKSKSA